MKNSIRILNPKNNRRRGFAMITAFWLMLVGVMLVTTMASILQGALMMSSNEGANVRARMSATSAMMKALADLIEDRPAGSTDTPGLIITEVMNNPYLGNTVSINGCYVNGLSDRVSVYNWGPKPLDISTWTIRGYNNGTSSWNGSAAAFGGGTTLNPGRAIWLTGDFVTNSGNSTVYLYNSSGTTADSSTIATGASGEKWVCLPDGANSGASNSGQYVNQVALNPNNGLVYRWIKAPFEFVPGGAPGASDTNGAGMWMDSYTLEKHIGSSVSATYSFPQAKVFLRYEKSLVIKNDTTGLVWTLGTDGDTQIALPLASGIPWLDHTAANSDSIAFILKGPSGNISQTGSMNDSVAGQHWRRTSTTDPMASLALGGAATAGTPDASYTIQSNPFISEVYDPSSAGGTNYQVISKATAGLYYGGATYSREAVEIYNPTGSARNLVANPLKIYFPASSNSVILNTGSIPAYGFYLWTDSKYVINTVGVTADFVTGALGTYKINTNNQLGLYDNASGTLYDTGFASSGNLKTRERKAFAASTNATMQVGGADVDNGNSYDVNGTTADFVEHASTLSSVVQWKNSSSAPEPPPAQPYDGNEFVEISLGPAPASASSSNDGDRRYEFIEIQNVSGANIDLEADDWWISIGSATGANPRRISALNSGSATLTDGAVGVIAAIDADTSFIANLSGLNPAAIQWFGLGAASGTPTDTMIGANGLKTITDTAFNIVLGFGGGPAPATKPFWYGIAFPDMDSGSIGTDTSWQKALVSVYDDTTSPFSTFTSSNWAQNDPNPGIGLSSAGRFGYDGYGDTWYKYNYDTFVKLYTNSGLDVYYRLRIMDEGAKINANWCARASDASLYNIVSRLFQVAPDPPFKGGGGLTATKADSLLEDLRSTWADSILVTPVSLYLLYTNLNHPYPRFFPWLTIYGYNEPGVFPLNINMAETPVLTAVFQQMLAASSTDSKYPTLSLTNARIQAAGIANKVYDYLTNRDGGADVGLSDDTGFYSVTEAYNKTLGLMTDIKDTNALSSAGLAKFSNYINVNSTNYFTLWAMGFVYRQGKDVLTDTPISTYRIAAVAHRSSDADKANFLYWREVFEVSDTSEMIFTTPIGTRRYPKSRWDSEQ